MPFTIIKKIDNLFLYIIFFFVFFECLIGRSIFNNLVSIRTICYFLLLINTLFIFKKGYKINQDKSLVIFGLYYIIIGLIHCSFWGNGYKFYLYPFIFPLFVCFFSNIQTVTNISLERCKKILIYIAVYFIIINIILYFIDLPIWNKSRPWGRITRGYSTVDVITLNLTLILLLIDKTINLKFYKRLFLTFVVTIGIIVQASGSGMVYLIIIYVSTFYLCIKKKKDIYFKEIKKTLGLLFITIFLFLTSAFTYISIKYPYISNGFIYMVSSRALVIIGQSNDNNTNTMEMRKKQGEIANKTFIKNDTDFLLGIGFSSISLTERTNQTLYIEEQYSLNKITIGYIGNSLFILIILYNLYKLRYLKELYLRIMYGCFWTIFALSCKTVAPLNIVPLIIYYSFYYTLFYKELKGIKHIRAPRL